MSQVRTYSKKKVGFICTTSSAFVSHVFEFSDTEFGEAVHDNCVVFVDRGDVIGVGNVYRLLLSMTCDDGLYVRDRGWTVTLATLINCHFPEFTLHYLKHTKVTRSDGPKIIYGQGDIPFIPLSL